MPINSLTDLWIPAYHRNRYLAALSDNAFRERGHDILMNAMRLDDDRKYRPHFCVDDRGYYVADRGIDWLRLLTDFHTELTEFRDGRIDLKPQAGETAFAERMADEAWAWRPDLVSSSDTGHEYKRPSVIFKFGARRWNEAILETGEIRLRPASHYGDPSLNRAIRDDELSIRYFSADGTEGVASIEDYHVACFSMTYDYRLFRDFDADSCLVIHDVKEFSDRLGRATIEVFRRQISAPTIYFDPHNSMAPTSGEEIAFGKHFRHAYQREFRYVWTSMGSEPLAPVQLQIGSIRDIAELVARA